MGGAFFASALWRIGRFAVPALLAVAAFIWINGVLDERARLRGWQANIVTVVAAEVPADRRGSVNPATAADEVRWLGRELRTGMAALERHAAATREASRRASEALEAAENARKAALQRNEAREAVRTRITDPQRTGGLTQAEWGEL